MYVDVDVGRRQPELDDRTRPAPAGNQARVAFGDCVLQRAVADGTAFTYWYT